MIVISESTDEPISLEEAAANMGVDPNDDSPPSYHDADEIQRCIRDARVAAEDALELSLIRRVVEIQRDSLLWHGDQLHHHHQADRWRGARRCIELPYGPVREIVSVRYLDGDGVDTLLAADQYRFTPTTKANPALLLPAYGVSWPTCRHDVGSVRVRYDTGYPSDDSPEQSVPGAIMRAIKLGITHFYVNKGDDGGAQVDLPPGFYSLLNAWRQGLGV